MDLHLISLGYEFNLYISYQMKFAIYLVQIKLNFIATYIFYERYDLLKLETSRAICFTIIKLIEYKFEFTYII